MKNLALRRRVIEEAARSGA